MEKSAEALFQERKTRVEAVIRMQVPDRVPLEINYGYFPAKYCGISCEAAYYDYEGWLEANKKTCVDFGADWSGTQSFFPGSVLELILPRSLAWPGHGTSACHGHQAIENEFMKENDYPALLGDHTDYMLRTYLPRLSPAMEGFKNWPSLTNWLGGYREAIALAEGLSDPEVAKSIERMQQAGRELRRWQPKMDSFVKELNRLGFPSFIGGQALAPFDAISDNLRGMKGSMLDIYRRQDDLLEACDIFLKRTLARIPEARPGEINSISIPTHRGSEGFMSLKQFAKLYWPTLRGLIAGLVDKGLTPMVFFEGDYTSRLEYLLEVPRGKVFAHFDTTDMFKAKNILGGHMSLAGNVPCSILQTGTPDDVRAQAKKLIDIVGKDGGYIMSTRSPVDDVEPANLKALIDFTIEYGVYR